LPNRPPRVHYPGVRPCPRHGRHVATGPLVVGTRGLAAQSGQTGITPYPAFVPTKRRSPRKEAHPARSAHIGAPMANTSQPRNWPCSLRERSLYRPASRS
jgi:hypothetical protein